MANVLQPHHLEIEAARAQRVRRRHLIEPIPRLDAEAGRVAKLRDGKLIVPACGSRFADFPRDLRWAGALACLGSAAIVVSAIVLAVRFVAVL